ncbi:MAG: thioredoxin [Halobacteriota archaeon]
MSQTDETPTYTEPVQVKNERHLNELVDASEGVLVDFHADWCGPCKMLSPVMETIAADTDVTVAKVDVDENQQLAAAFGVRGIPMMTLFVDGNAVEKAVGFKPEDEIRALIDRNVA